MIHIKKPICTCVTFLMVLSLFASCGNVETDQPSDVTTIQQDSQNSGVTGSLGTYAGSGDYLTYDEVSELYPDKTILVWQLDMGTADIRALEVNEYLDSLGKDYAVCFEPMVPFFANSDGKSYTQSVKVKIDNGEQIDIINTGSSVSGIDSGSPYDRFCQNGWLEKLDSYLTDTQAGQALYAAIPEKMWQAFVNGDGIYGVFASALPPTAKNYSYISLNANMVDKYGYNMDESMYSQIDIVKEINEEHIFMSDYVNVFGMPYMWGTEDFAYFSEADDKYISIFDTPFYSDIFRTFYELDTNRDGFISSIAQEMPFYENAFVRLQYYVKYPLDTENPTMYSGVPRYNILIKTGDDSLIPYGSATGICSYSEHKDEAFDLLALSLTDEHLNNLLVYGTEEDYTVENGVVAYSDSYSQNFSRFANIFICMPNVDTHTSEEYLEMINNLGELTSNGFSFDSSNVSEQVQYLSGILPGALEEEENIKNPQIKLQLMLYRSEGVDFDTFYEEFKDYMYSLGLQDVIDEYNRQYTEWRNAQ